MNMSPALAREHVTRHLLGAERSAGARDVSRLGPLRRLVRALLLQELRRYRRSGQFPHNPDFAAPTPYFVDAAQTRCAVAHLLALSGEGALVQRIARERNHARVRELADEPRLVAWLAAAGLSLEEAAAIQPTYPTTVERAACVCGGQVGEWGSDIAPFGALPARGVIVGSTLRSVDAGLVVRVDTARGDIAPFQPGDEVYVRPTTADVPSAVGDTVVVAVQPGSSGSTDAGTSGGTATDPLPGAVLAEDDTYTCMSGNLQLGPLDQDQLLLALQAANCEDRLALFDPRWGEIKREKTRPLSCSVATDSASDPTSLSILLALVSTLVARRRRAR